ncbi:hypothetical protein L596_001265 [Steinernema carpocapsae]|uniref:Uncharacterized protein n=1 Tax=Steinernema carpocapsae TaxID=34508 RepID=A0A4U8UKR6_STECR|nr:hypothetical protein L596_001265 [Steinernema carpocapsae]
MCSSSKEINLGKSVFGLNGELTNSKKSTFKELCVQYEDMSQATCPGALFRWTIFNTKPDVKSAFACHDCLS